MLTVRPTIAVLLVVGLFCVLSGLPGEVGSKASAAPPPLALYAMEEGPPEASQTADAQGGTAAAFNNMSAGNWSGTFLAPVPTGSTYALALDNRSPQNFLNVPGFKGVTGTNPRSVAAWINTTLQNQAIVSWGSNSTGQKWTFRVQENNGQTGAIRIEVNGGFKVGSTRVDDGRWHHVALVWPNDGSPDVNDALFYVDGVEESYSATQGQSINTGSNADVRIGQDFSNRYFNGVVDDVRIFNVALSPADVAELAGPDAGAITPVLNFDAAADTTPGNGTWEDTRRDYRPGSFDWNLSGVTHNASPTTALPGIGAAYTFEGGDTANFGSSDFQDDFPGNLTNNPFSCEVWFQPDDPSGTEVLVDLGGSGDGSSLTLNNNILQFVAKHADNSSGVSADLSGIGTGEFIQAVGVIDLEGDLLSLYVNGRAVSTAFTGGDWAGTDTHALGSKGGTVGGTGGFFGDIDSYGTFQGDVGIVRFFADALTRDEVLAAYDAVATTAVIPEPSTFALAALGLLSLGLIGCRRRRRR